MSKIAHPSPLVTPVAACGLAPILFLCFVSQPIVAKELPAAEVMQYRRIYVPAEKIETWPRDGEKYIPIEVREFESWVRSANDAASSRNAKATIDIAEYTATLDNGRLQGEGRWSIVLHGDKPAFLPLGDLSLILRDAHWQGPPKQPARLGIWGRSGHEPDRYGLEVSCSGTLKFSWHIQTHATSDQLEIPWRTPAANSMRLLLDLPEGKQPRIDGGVVLESTPRASDDRTPGKPLRRWLIALSPSTDTTLQIMNADRKIPPTSPLFAMREKVNYHVGPRGLDVTATWQLDRPAAQKREVSVSVPAGLQLTSLKADGHDLAWRIVRDTSSPTDTALIQLPKTDASKPVQLSFIAWQPLVLGASWRLPRLRPEGVFWTAGEFDVSVSADFELKRLEPKDCIETDVRLSTAGADTPETHSFTAYAPSALLEINLARRRAIATIRAGSSLALADPDLNGRLVAQWTLAESATHQLTGKLAAGWVVEAVETIPADAMAEWFIDRQGDERRIEIQLSRAASVNRNVSVIITARLQRFSLAEPISAETMRMVAWSHARTAQHLLTFQSNEPYAIDPVGAIRSVDRNSIDDDDLALLDQSADNRIFDVTDAGKDTGLQLTFRRGEYAAHIDLELTYENEVLRHEYHVTAQPDSNPIDRLIVHSSAPLGEDVRWTDRGSNTPLAAERLVADDGQRAKLPNDGDAWLLRFPQPTSRQIKISAIVSTPLPKQKLVPLFCLPEASRQDGRILVRSRKQNSLWLEPSQLQSIPLPHEAPGENELNSLPSVCAAYRYQPADCLDVARSPKLWATAASGETRAVTVRHIQMESYFSPDGSGTHSAICQLENRGATEMKIALAENARLTTASLDGYPLDVAVATGSDQAISIRLPPLTRSTRISLYFETRGPPLAAGDELTPPLAVTDLPFFAGDWIVWLPEEYSATGSGLSSAEPEFNWRRRLFGLLGRPSGERPFNPLRLSEGAASVNTDTDGTAIEPQTKSSQQRPQATATPATGWRGVHQSFIANGPAPIVVMHPPSKTAWAVVLLLSCLLCGRWLNRRQPELFAIVLAIAAAVALLLPTAHADLAAGAVLGLLLSLAADWPRRPVTAEEFPPVSRAKTAIGIVLAVAIVIGLTKHSSAESPKGDSVAQNTPASNIYRVLIPTDAEGRLSGTKVYLSEKFLRALVAAGPDAAPAEGRWLLSEAAFAGELADKPGDTVGIVAGNWTLNFSIETRARDTTVVLPLIQNQANWNPTAMLDGVPLPLKWRDGGRSCEINIAEPGQYALAIACIPKTTIADGRNQMAIAIPPVPGSKVEVRASESATGLTVSHASVLPRAAAAPNVLNAELQRNDRLNIQWSRSEKLEAGKQGLNITELRWLDIKPAETELTIKYVLEGGARRPNSLTIAYEDGWKLLTDEKSIAHQPATSPGQQIIRVPILSQPTDRQEVSLRWRLTDPLPLGNLRLPPVELTSVPAGKRWLAISTDPSRQCEIPDSSASEETSNEFRTKWGDLEAKPEPQLVLSNLEPGAMPVLAIHPRETVSTVEDVTNVAVGPRALRVNYDSTVIPGNFGACQTGLSLPENLSIDEITVADGNRSIPLRWSRSERNRVDIFFGQKMSKAYRLMLNGSLPLDANGKANLPHISALATEAETQTVQLYRDDDVRVELEGVSASMTDPINSPPSLGRVRPLGVCYLDDNSATAARVVAKVNAVRVAGDTLTALTRENGAWTAGYRCQLVAEDGDLDVLRLRVPQTWAGPFDVQSAVAVSTDLKPIDDQNAILLIRFAATIAKGNGVDLRIRSPLKPANDTGVSVPAIVPELFSRGRRYISVPQTVDSQPMLWTEVGVRPAIISPKLLAGFAGPTPANTFEVTGLPFQVTSRSQAVQEVKPQIRLADTAVLVGDLGTQLIVTRLILAARGLSFCTLQLPPGQTLITVQLDGRPALIRALDQTHWQVALSAPQLPQALEIVSRSAVESFSDGRSELERPMLLVDGKSIPAEVSLWSFAHPLKSASRHVNGADEMSPIEQAALRFDRLVSIAEAAKGSAAELPPPDGSHWFESWSKLLTDARIQTQHTTAVRPLERAASQVSHTSDEQISLATKRFEKWLDECRKTLAGSDPQEAKFSPTSDNSSSSRITTPAIGRRTYYVADGGNDRLTIHQHPVSPSAGRVRIVGLLLIVSLLVATIWLMRWSIMSDFLCRWPHAIGILLGIGWWAWMWPSWIGILIVAGSLWLALRFDWPGRSLRTEASTVLRSTRTI